MENAKMCKLLGGKVIKDRAKEGRGSPAVNFSVDACPCRDTFQRYDGHILLH